MKAETLWIRADAGPEIGMGHVMRCLALAQAWREQGGEAVFVGAIQGDDVRERLQSEGFDIEHLPGIHPDPRDIERVLHIIPGRGWCVLDGYRFDRQYQALVRRSGMRLLVVDDYGHLDGYEADLLLNQNIHAYEIPYGKLFKGTLLLGMRYSLLRKEFCEMQPSKHAAPKVERLLVTMGGADPDKATLKVMETLNRLSMNALEVQVIAGPLNQHLKLLEQAAREAPYAARITDSVQDMPDLMAWADAAVSAAGSTCWELLYMGVPLVVAVLAENQEGLAHGLAEHGAALSFGWLKDAKEEFLEHTLDRFLKDTRLREGLVEAGRNLVDGQGAPRVVRAMKEMS